MKKYTAENRLPVPKLDRFDTRGIQEGLKNLKHSDTTWNKWHFEAGLDAIAVKHSLVTVEDLPNH